MKLQLTDRELEALRMALLTYADSYQNDDELNSTIKQDIKAVGRILAKIEAR
jgi:hypothetical protein